MSDSVRGVHRCTTSPMLDTS